MNYSLFLIGFTPSRNNYSWWPVTSCARSNYGIQTFLLIQLCTFVCSNYTLSLVWCLWTWSHARLQFKVPCVISVDSTTVVELEFLRQFIVSWLHNSCIFIIYVWLYIFHTNTVRLFLNFNTVSLQLLHWYKFYDRGGGNSAHLTESHEHPLVMTIDLYNDDIDQWKFPKSFPRRSPGGFMPKYGQKSKKVKISLNHSEMCWNWSG